MKRFLALIALALALVAPASAQTITATLAWNSTDSPTQLAADTTTLVLDAQAPVVITPTCTSVGTGSACTQVLANFNAGVAHTGTLKLTNVGGSGQASFTYTPGATSAPSNPSGAKITIVISVP